MKVIVPTYLPLIPTFAAINQGDVVWEVCGTYQKQSYRNRSLIATDRGALTLTIPIAHRNHRQAFQEVQIDPYEPWQRTHWRGIQTAYRSAPYFEFYEDRLVRLFEESFTYLIDVNFKSMEILCQCAKLPIPQSKTDEYVKELTPDTDKRMWASSKYRPSDNPKPYAQVFSDRHGFIQGLSFLDLLCNEGPSSIEYLKHITL